MKGITTLRVTAAAAFVVLLAAGLAWRLDQLYRAAQVSVAPVTGVPEDRKLFHELMQAGVLLRRPDGRLDRLPEDWSLRQRIANTQGNTPAERAALERKRRLLQVLDNSAVGSIVGKQITLWNSTREIVAIRDDRPHPTDDQASRWNPYAPDGRPLVQGELVPESFGFIHQGKLHPGYTDWLTAPEADGPVTFRTTVMVREPRTLTIEVIGEPVGLPAGARTKIVEGKPGGICEEPPKASIVTLPLHPSERPVPISVTAKPTVNCDPVVHGLAISMIPDEGGHYSRYAFRPVKPSRPSGRFAILTADGVFLTSKSGDGRPTDEAYDLGVVPEVGTGPADSFSLSGLIGGSRLPPGRTDVRLTIESDIQRAAQRAVEWGVGRFPKNDRFADERKSALVILDAKTGAILGVGNWPTVPKGVNPWDFASFAAAFPLRDPSSVIAWEVIDKHNTPGSTFKPIVSTALMSDWDPVRDKIKLIAMGLPPAQFAARTGIAPGASSYSVLPGSKPIPNFGGAPMSRYFGRVYRDGERCGVDAPVDHDLGLAQGIEFSLNVFFARMAVMMEKPKIEHYLERLRDNRGDRFAVPEMTLTRTARWLGIDDRRPLDIGSNVPPDIGLKRYSGTGGTDVLYAQLARSTLAQMSFTKKDHGVRNLLMYTVALNGIGQTVSASPLQMAQAVASISGVRRVHAFLLSQWGRRKLPVPATQPLPVDKDMYAQLRRGMKAVPEVGTARGVFPGKLPCRIYGKTGTAEIDAKRAYNTAWFVGWLDPSEPGGRRLAFACMMTHATGRLRFGGTGCAPIVSKAIQAIEQTSAPEKETPGPENPQD